MLDVPISIFARMVNPNLARRYLSRKLSFKTTEEVKEEVTASLAALKEISADAAGVAVLSKLDGILPLKERTKKQH